MSHLPPIIKVKEVGPRDGLQAESAILPTEAKLRRLRYRAGEEEYGLEAERSRGGALNLRLDGREATVEVLSVQDGEIQIRVDGRYVAGASRVTAPTLLLTTRGRRSGKLRRTALIYGEDGEGRYVLVASKGGADEHPSWYLNLLEHPEVGLQVGAERFAARARAATAEEKPRLWRLMASIWPPYADYQRKTEREIPVVIAERL